MYFLITLYKTKLECGHQQTRDFKIPQLKLDPVWLRSIQRVHCTHGQIKWGSKWFWWGFKPPKPPLDGTLSGYDIRVIARKVGSWMITFYYKSDYPLHRTHCVLTLHWKHTCWNGNVILMKFSSLVVLEIVILTHSVAASDDNFVNMTISPFQCLSLWTEFPTYWNGRLDVRDWPRC